MRIVHCFRAPVGGLFRHVLDLATAQAALGHDVGMIADSNAVDPLTEGRLAAAAPSLQLGIARFPMHRLPHPSDIAALRGVLAHARTLAPDILHGHGAKGGLFARVAGWRLKSEGRAVKTFYTPHGGSLNYRVGSFESRVFLGIESLLDKISDGLIFESAFAAGVYGQRIPHGTASRCVVPNGLRPDDFVDHVPAAGAADLVFIGELREAKGVDILVRAIAEINSGEARPVTAVIVGSGPDSDALKKLAASLGQSDHIAFPGAMPARAAFPLGRVMVVPSRKESFPYVVLEAAAAGIPLVSTNVGGIPEIVAGTDTALIPADDVPVLATAISEIVRAPILAQARAQRLKLAVAQKFTVEAMTAAILQFYATAGQKSHAVSPKTAPAHGV